MSANTFNKETLECNDFVNEEDEEDKEVVTKSLLAKKPKIKKNNSLEN